MPPRFIACWLSGVLAFSLAYSSPVLADDLDNISVEGVITDVTQQRIVNAEITLTSNSSNQSRKTVSDSTGHYRFSASLPGSYKLQVKVNGFQNINWNFEAAAGTAIRQIGRAHV